MSTIYAHYSFQRRSVWVWLTVNELVGMQDAGQSRMPITETDGGPETVSQGRRNMETHQ